MMLCHEIKDMVQTLKACDRDKQRFLLKKVASAIRYCNKEDLQMLLDFINTSYDMELQVKLFSILSFYLMNKDACIKVFVTCSPLYEAMDRVISKNLPRKTLVVINFLTLLLQGGFIENYTWRRSSLYVHTQNQIRISGCLASMAEIFINGMMYQDTWRALCRCLVETFNDSVQNQNFCTYLIPKCVKLCNLRNMETFPVLQGLIYKNKRNVQLFLECDGMSLFKRELLQYESILHLLNSVVETSIEATMVAQDMSILQHVHDLWRLCGPYTPTGDWATTILYNADMKIKKYETEQTENKRTKHDEMSKTAISQNFHIFDDVNDTMLFRNVIKEVVQWHAKEEDIYKNIFMSNKSQQQISTCWNMDTKQFGKRPQPYDFYNNVKKNICAQRTRPSDEFSFSFLKKHFRDSNKYALSSRDNITKKSYKIAENCTKAWNDQYVKISLTNSIVTNTTQTPSQSNIRKFYEEYENNGSLLDLKEFKPNFVSTPKHSTNNLKKIQDHKKNISVKKRKLNKFKKSLNSTIARNKGSDISIKARIFNAINNSCTAVINSVTGIFKPRNVDHTIKDSNSMVNNDDLATCSYSFTEYMRKRDAVLDNKTVHHNAKQNFSIEPESCRSCNSTKALKLKMVNDNFLKETVKKLKVGINMYGCDFKKISNIMWPHEAYMTPAMLYNLYRKLLLK